MLAHNSDHRTQEAMAGGWPQVQGQSELPSEFKDSQHYTPRPCCQKTKQNKFKIVVQTISLSHTHRQTLSHTQTNLVTAPKGKIIGINLDKIFQV